MVARITEGGSRGVGGASSMGSKNVKVIKANSKPLTSNSIQSIRRAEKMSKAAQLARIKEMQRVAQLPKGHVDYIAATKKGGILDWK